MKIRHLIIPVLAASALVSACQQPENLGAAELTINPAELNFGTGAGSQTLTLKATRDWVVADLPDWLALDPQSGLASSKEQTVTVTVMPNSGVDRTEDVKFSIGLMTRTLKVSQQGEAGDESEALLYFNDFDKEAAPTASPFPYCDATDIWKNQTGNGIASLEYLTQKLSVRGNSPSNTHNSPNYTGSGVNNLLFGENGFLAIKKIELKGATSLVMTFGTERYLYGASDNTFDHKEFLVSASIDGEHFANVEYTFPNGDLSGTWDLATAAFAVPAGTEYLYLHFTSSIVSGHRLDDLKILRGGNGEVLDYAGGKIIDISGSDTPGGGDTPSGDYETAPATTVANFITTDGKTLYRLTGKVSAFQKGTTTAGKNWMQFNLTDDTGSILVYGFQDGQYEAWNTKISDGGTAVVVGTYEFYTSNSQHEVMNARVMSFTPGEAPVDPTETSTLAAIIASADNTVVASEELFVGAVTNQGYVATDGKDAIYVFASSAPGVNVGDKVSFTGTKTTYYGLPEITGPKTTVKSSGATVPYPAPKDITSVIDTYTASVAEYITIQAEAYQSGSYINYKVEGATRGVELSSVPANLIASVKPGDKVTLTGYFNTIQSTRNNVLLILVSVEGGSGSDTPGGGDTPTDPVDATSNLAFEAGTSSQLGSATVNGGAAVDVLKMGTSSKIGEGTITVPAGSAGFSFIAVGWTTVGTAVVFEYDGKSTSFDIPANASVANNSPWTITLGAEDVVREVRFDAPCTSDVKVAVKTSNTGTYKGFRAILFGFKKL